MLKNIKEAIGGIGLGLQLMHAVLVCVVFYGAIGILLYALAHTVFG